MLTNMANTIFIVVWLWVLIDWRQKQSFSLKEELLHVRLVAVVPFRGQSNRWSAIEQRRYRLLLAQADKVVVLSEHYYQGCLLRRNDYMLAHSCGVIAYFDGKPKGGTYLYLWGKPGTKDGGG